MQEGKSFFNRIDFNSPYRGWINFLSGQLYLDKGNYQKAKVYLESLLKEPKKLVNYYNVSPEDVNKARVLGALGTVELRLNSPHKSQQNFEKSLSLYAKHYGKEHLEYAITLADYSQFYIRTKKYKTAEQMITQALTILQKNKHPEQYKCHEYRGDLYLAQEQPQKAYAAYGTALTIAKQHFPKKSAHITRLKSKTPFIQRFIFFLKSYWN